MCRWDATIQHQRCQRTTGNFTAYGIETRNGDCFGRVVNNHVYASSLLKCMDVPSVASNDAPLHLIRRDGYGGSGDFTNVVGSHALNGSGDDLTCPPVAIFLGFCLHLADDACHVIPGTL